MCNMLRVKCVVVGNAAVGKTALVQVFLHGGTYFPKNYSMTTGVSLSVGKVNIPESNDVVEIYIHDCSGKEMYSNFVQELWFESPLVVIVFDTCNTASFDSVPTWAEEISKRNTPVLQMGVLVGTKADLRERRCVAFQAAQEMAQRIGFHYLEVSSKQADGVQEPFFYLASLWHRLFYEKAEFLKSLI